jgi:hypothetical protein
MTKQEGSPIGIVPFGFRTKLRGVADLSIDEPARASPPILQNRSGK